MPQLDPETLAHALSVARREGFLHVKLKAGTDRFQASLSADWEDDWVEEPTLAAEDSPPMDITSPLVGFYREASSPLREGEPVEAGQVVAYVEALGLANEVIAGCSGTVVEVRVKPGDPVDYGLVIARVQP